MDDTTASDQTFVSVDKFAAVPEATAAPSDPFPQRDPTYTESIDGYLAGRTFDGDDLLTPLSDNEQYNPRDSGPVPNSNDQSAFMWGLGGTAPVHQSSGSEDDAAEDPSDVCGQFSTDPIVGDGESPIMASHSDWGSVLDSSPPNNPTPTHSDSHPSPHEASEYSPHMDLSQNGSSRGTPEQNEHAVREAGAGMSSYEVQDPFSPTANSPESQVIVYSEMGPVTPEEEDALEELAKENSSPSARVVHRLLETIKFQKNEIGNLKTAEMEMADNVITSHARRYSEVEKERSVAISTLIEELDEQRRQSTELEEQNNGLQTQLEKVETQNDAIVGYYKEMDRDFTFSDGVATALDSMATNLREEQKERIETIDKQHGMIDGYAQRLAEMENVLFSNRKRYEQLQTENEEIRVQLEELEEVAEQKATRTPSPIRRHSSPSRSPDHKVEELKLSIGEQEQEIKALKTLLDKSKNDQKRVNDAFLSLNVDLEDVRSKTSRLIKQRDAAENKCKELTRSASANKERYFRFSNEMAQNLVNVVNELENKDTEVRAVSRNLDAREKAYSSLGATVTQLEEQLQSVTDAAIKKSRNISSRKSSTNDEVIETIIDSLRHDVSQAQSILKQRTEECNNLQNQVDSKEEALISLRTDYNKLHTAASIRRLSSVGPRSMTYNIEEQQSEFLRRLSTKLGCHADNGKDLVSKLTERIEALVGERSTLEEVANDLRRDIKSRESSMHCVRSEMQAEISSLKAEMAYLENLRRRAQEEREFAESKLLAVLNDKDHTHQESVGDITSSSTGNRGWSIGDASDLASRRGSIFSVGAGDETVHWNDPVIEAAVQSVCALIGTKDELASRNRELRERLESLLDMLPAEGDAANVTKSLIIQSKDFQEELARVVGMQQDIIDKVVRQSAPAEPSGDETLSYINEDLSPARATGNSGRVTIAALLHQDETSNPRVLRTKTEMGEAAGFLSDQLAETRALYNEKLKANAQLCGVVNELEQELEHIKSSGTDTESTLAKFQDTHQHFIAGLAAITGAEVSMVAIEDRVRSRYLEFHRLESDLVVSRGHMAAFRTRATQLLAQKRFLAHVIDMYQSKYRLDVFTRPSGEEQTLRSRFRVRVLALVAMKRLFAAKNMNQRSPIAEVRELYDVPNMAPIAKRRPHVLSLIDASVSVLAVPKLEAAIVEKESQIAKLRSSIESLNRSLVRASGQSKDLRPDLPSSFSYQDDLMDRKNDMSRRLRKLINDNEKLESLLSKEKQLRVASDAKSSRYHEKISNLKRKLGKAASNAECKERTYKAAIRYLKSKADKAMESDLNMDENVDPIPQIPATREAGKRDAHNDSRSALEIQLSSAEERLTELETGTIAHDELARFVSGLRKAIRRLEKPMLYSGRTRVDDDGSNERLANYV